MDLEIFKYLLPSQRKRVEDELQLLKERKLEQDKVRFSEDEEKLVTTEDRTKLAQLHPVVRILVIRTLVRARDFGIRLGIHAALRSYEEQAALWAKGRDIAGNVVNQQEVVTNAIAGHSWHNYGLAVDLVMDGSPKPGLQWTWDDNVDTNQDGKSDWNQIGEVGESFGLTWGGRFQKPAPVDKPHFQYHKGLATVTDALRLYKPAGPQFPGMGGMQAVWDAIV